ncbi:hypothetical protein [Nocardioides sp.]|uniref:hypothetical protein n=1 Tax=Nocardioides sp. TaxID=35761 RepID=UPI00286D6DE8|nr:hypothetical protein [Nocardioides sp.]
MSTEVADWMTAQTFRPRLTITGGPTDRVVAAVREEFERVGYKVHDVTPARTRLRHHDWFAMASGVWARTEVVLSPGVDSVLVEVTRGAENRKARKLGQQALNAALESLPAQGIDLTVGAWHKAS